MQPLVIMMNQSSIFAHQTIPHHRLDALCEEGNEEPRAPCQRDIEIARDNIYLLKLKPKKTGSYVKIGQEWHWHSQVEVIHRGEGCRARATRLTTRQGTQPVQEATQK